MNRKKNEGNNQEMKQKQRKDKENNIKGMKKRTKLTKEIFYKIEIKQEEGCSK